ncbi:MAG: hypothetical protein KOO62_10250 [candidate division Zixibacteria bacterium]|nr:hypothetical protein [candidate division Zixibacteria bacterium]
MKHCFSGTLSLCLSLLLVIALFCSEIQAVTVYQLELTDGTIFESISFKIDDVYKVITFNEDGKKRNISFTEIAGIYNADGSDITEILLGPGYGAAAKSQTRQETQPIDSGGQTAVDQKQSGWVSETSEKYKQGQKALYSVAFRLGGNYSIPATDYYDGIKSGLGYGFDIVVPVTRKIAIRGTISKSGMEDDPDQLLSGSGMVPIRDNLSLDVWRYFVSAEYYSWPRYVEGSKTMYYLYSGLGAISHSFSGSILALDISTDEIWAVTYESQSKFAFTLGGGLVTMFSNSLGLDTRAAADLVIVGTDSNEYGMYGRTQQALVFDLKVGLVAMIR